MGSAACTAARASLGRRLASVNCRQSSDRSSVHGIFLTMISINVRAEETRVAGVAAPPLLPQHLLIWVPRARAAGASCWAPSHEHDPRAPGRSEKFYDIRSEGTAAACG